MSTRVLPDPAGAMTRAGPDPWATAASWSGARSAAGRRPGGGTGPDVARLDRLGVARRPHPPASAAGVVAPRAAVDPRRGAVGQQHVAGVRRPRRGRAASAPAFRALRPHHQIGSPRRGRRRCWPTPGSGAGRAVEVEAGRQGRRSSSEAVGPQERGARNSAGSTPRATTTGGAGAQARAGRRPRRIARSGAASIASSSARSIGDHGRTGPRRGHRVAHVDDDAPAEAGRARCASWRRGYRRACDSDGRPPSAADGRSRARRPRRPVARHAVPVGQVRRRDVGAGDVDVEAQLLGGRAVLVDLAGLVALHAGGQLADRRRPPPFGPPPAAMCSPPRWCSAIRSRNRASSSAPRRRIDLVELLLGEQAGHLVDGTGMPIHAIASSERSSRL